MKKKKCKYDGIEDEKMSGYERLEAIVCTIFAVGMALLSGILIYMMLRGELL